MRGRAVGKKEEEEDLLGAFFFRIYEFLFTFSDPPLVVHRPHVPARYAIKFVPASDLSHVPVNDSDDSDDIPSYDVISSTTFSSSSTAYSVISSANFVLAPCIGTNH